MRLRTIARTWGASNAELAASYPCEAYASEPCERLMRAVTVRADPGVVFRWLCQLKVAPYSYDLLDNLGRRSPRDLTPGAERLAVGQLFLVCRISDYDEGHHITGTATPRANRLFGVQSLTYQIDPVAEQECRVVVCLVVEADGWWSRARNTILAAGDLVMMRKQLLTLKACAESSMRDAGAPS
ncbi:MAG: hypothetical protein WKF54_05705 [Nocardioidaceae bacterium]